MVILMFPSKFLSALLWGLKFYNISFQHLGLSGKSWGLRSVLEGYPFDFLCLAFLRRRLQSRWNIYPAINLCVRFWGFSSNWFCLRSILFYPGCWYLPSHIVELRWDYCPFYSFVTGSLKFSEGLLCYREVCTEKYSPFLLFSPFCDREGIDEIITFYLTGFLL